MITAVTSLLCIPAFAQEPSPQYTMTVIRDDSHGHRVLKGDYESAIDRITSAGLAAREEFSSQTNLCVAFTKAGHLDKADEACNAAVEVARERRDSRPRAARTVEYIVVGDRADLAVSLSNRGVLYAARGEMDQALADFKASLELDAGLSAPGANIARLVAGAERTN